MTVPPALIETLGLDRGPLARLLAVLDGAGEEARLVGGAVRNALLGLAPGDVDIATTATPEEVMRRAAAARFKPVPTGVEHGTVTVVVDGQPFEVTTLREDVETYGRKARVEFGRDWRRDAERRDFTINALSVARDGTVHDYVGGLADLAARRVRFIGDPARRIAEDYLRILRFFRFHADYGEGALDPEGLRACIRARGGLDSLSRERVRMEIVKLLVTRRVLPTLVVMAETGILGAVLGGVPQLASFASMIKVETAAGLAGDPTRRLGALAVLVIEDAERLRERLRLSNAEFERLYTMADGWWRVAPGDVAGRALLYRLGAQRFVDRALLAWSRANAGAADAAWQEMATLPQRWAAPRYPLRAADFTARGIACGPALGAALAAAEEAWIAAGFPMARDTLAHIADEAVRKSGAR
ncbi:MAG TPA: CCA tRNA nucleotidyltransferase [Xanthobacteraceae bacterium]